MILVLEAAHPVPAQLAMLGSPDLIVIVALSERVSDLMRDCHVRVSPRALGHQRRAEADLLAPVRAGTCTASCVVEHEVPPNEPVLLQ